MLLSINVTIPFKGKSVVMNVNPRQTHTCQQLHKNYSSHLEKCLALLCVIQSYKNSRRLLLACCPPQMLSSILGCDPQQVEPEGGAARRPNTQVHVKTEAERAPAFKLQAAGIKTQ